MNFELGRCENILVVGAGHGIGHAIVEEILSCNSSAHIFATYRLNSMATGLLNLKESYSKQITLFNLDPTNDSALKELAIDLKSKNIQLDMIINCVGLLHGEGISPEKSLRNFNTQEFLQVMLVNSCVTPLLAKHFESLFSNHKTTAFLTLSAKVGSIEDNRIGGWYSYRASKAALNMLIKNIAIEFSRKKKDCLVLAIHPGTTKTNLSIPFIKNTQYKIHSPRETAVNILNIMKKNNLNSGNFISWDGLEIPW